MSNLLPAGMQVPPDFTRDATAFTSAILTMTALRGRASGLDKKVDKALIKEIKEDADGMAMRIYRQIAFKNNLILMVRVSEGYGRDGVVESFRAREVVMPDILENEKGKVGQAISSGFSTYVAQNGTVYSILSVIVDVIEGTNALVFNVNGKELWDLKTNESGATSILVGGAGIDSLGNVPDMYADVVATYVPPGKRQEFIDNPLDPEPLAQDPSKIEGVLARIAAANGITINDLNVVVMDRPRETARLAVLNDIRSRYSGLEITTIKDGTVAPTLLATFGDRQGKHKVIMTVGGTPEAFFNLSVSGLFKKQGALLSLRVYSKQTNNTLEGVKDGQRDLANRYNFSGREKEDISDVRPHDADGILNGNKLFTQEMVNGEVRGSVSLTTHNGAFDLPGVVKEEDGAFEEVVLRFGDVQGKPTAWFERVVVRPEQVMAFMNPSVTEEEPDIVESDEQGRSAKLDGGTAAKANLNFADAAALNEALKGVVEAGSLGVKVLDANVLRGTLIDKLVYDATFNPNQDVVAQSRQLIKDIAAAQGITLGSVYNLYRSKAKDERQYTIPAINIRGMAFNTARAVFASAQEKNVGVMLLEIAKSEMGYTAQRPIEYRTSILAAAIKEGYNRSVYLQGDHFQIALKDYINNPDKARNAIKDLIREAMEAGFYNIDLDMSPLVDWSKSTPDEQQKLNYTETARLTAYVRQLETELGLDKLGITVNLGGEIGEIGMGMEKGKERNSNVSDLRAYMNGYNAEMGRMSAYLGRELAPITKIAIQTGTAHGGVRDAEGKLIDVKVGFNTIAEVGEVARKEFGLAGVVQHGASTLPTDYFVVFSGNKVPEGLKIEDEKLLNAQGAATLSRNPAAEVHLATAYQDTIIDHPAMPQDLRAEMRDWTLAKFPPKPGKNEEGEFVKNRKNAWRPYKEKVWDLPTDVQTSIRDTLTGQFGVVFDNLGVKNTGGIVSVADWGKLLAPIQEFTPFAVDINRSLSADFVAVNTAKDGRALPVVIHESTLDSPDGVMALQNYLRQIGKGNVKPILLVTDTQKTMADVDKKLQAIASVSEGRVTLNRGSFAAVYIESNADAVSALVKGEFGEEITEVVGPREIVENFNEGIIRATYDQARDGSQMASVAKALKLATEIIPLAAKGPVSEEQLKKLDALFVAEGNNTFSVAPTTVLAETSKAAQEWRMAQAAAEGKV
ncbi:MAG: fructose-bisphosphatase class II [Candidatus Omnitrophica bacterium]|nr:fructose-bisphosphatase class II [Candidatus Omnitrophota bacterium]